jgi:protocadherin-16/23
MYDTTTVQVTVLDENDNAPVFSSTTASLVLSIPENANMAVVHTVDAYDADIGDNGLVSFYISGEATVIVERSVFI